MNKIIAISIITITVIFAYTGCSSLTECDRVQQKELILLMDVTDQNLFEKTRLDLESSLQAFMQRSGLGTISTCQGLTLRLASITSNDRLDLFSESIAITRKGQSVQSERSQKSPEPILKLLRRKVDDYSAMSKDFEMTAESHIANTILKAVTAVNIDADQSTVLIFSDLIENSPFLNMYRRIPDESGRTEAIQRLLDPLALQKFRELRRQGLDPDIVVVLIPTFGSAVYQREVRNFWWFLFTEELGLQNVEFIDNLSQYRTNL